MIISDGPGIMLSATDCALLDSALRDALRFGWLGRRAVPPHALVKLADAVHTTAVRYSPEDRKPAVTMRAGPVWAYTDSASPTCGQEVQLTTAQAAARIGVSEGYLRKLARQGAVEAVGPGVGSARGWTFPASAVAAWAARREETNREAA